MKLVAVRENKTKTYNKYAFANNKSTDQKAEDLTDYFSNNSQATDLNEYVKTFSDFR